MVNYTRSLIVVLTAALFAVGCAHITHAPRYLFVQIGQSGSLKGDNLTLHNIAVHTIYFSDRPDRKAGYLPAPQFVQLWNKGSDSFRKDPPNATLTYVAEGKTSAAVFELQDVRIDGANMSFRVKVLQGTPPLVFSDVSLFIDSGGIMQMSAHGAQDVY